MSRHNQRWIRRLPPPHPHLLRAPLSQPYFLFLRQKSARRVNFLDKSFLNLELYGRLAPALSLGAILMQGPRGHMWPHGAVDARHLL